MMPTLLWEDRLGRQTGQLIAGVDEVGRGCLAGGVVACAVILPADLTLLPAGIADSKKLSAKKRATLAPLLKEVCRYGLGQASVDEIDTHNILQATFIAMRRALEALGAPRPDHALIDGNQMPPALPCAATTLIEGDSHSLSIAAASIIAKVARDEAMATLAETYPAYGWHKNAGYGTALHLAALAEHGVTPHHRRSFAPIAKIIGV